MSLLYNTAMISYKDLIFNANGNPEAEMWAKTQPRRRHNDKTTQSVYETIAVEAFSDLENQQLNQLIELIVIDLLNDRDRNIHNQLADSVDGDDSVSFQKQEFKRVVENRIRTALPFEVEYLRGLLHNPDLFHDIVPSSKQKNKAFSERELPPEEIQAKHDKAFWGVLTSAQAIEDREHGNEVDESDHEHEDEALMLEMDAEPATDQHVVSNVNDLLPPEDEALVRTWHLSGPEAIVTILRAEIERVIDKQLIMDEVASKLSPLLQALTTISQEPALDVLKSDDLSVEMDKILTVIHLSKILNRKYPKHPELVKESERQLLDIFLQTKEQLVKMYHAVYTWVSNLDNFGQQSEAEKKVRLGNLKKFLKLGEQLRQLNQESQKDGLFQVRFSFFAFNEYLVSAQNVYDEAVEKYPELKNL